MKKTKIYTLILSLLLIIGLTACGGGNENDQEVENYAVTQVVETAMAAISQTAAVQSPTPNNTPTFTPAPTSTSMPTATTGPTATLPPVPTVTSVFEQPSSETSTCDIGGFIKDVTIPDGTGVAAGGSFTKTWKIENIGTCTWNENYTIVFWGGDQLADAASYRFTDEDIEPGESVEVSVEMTAPTGVGTYTSHWLFKNDVGQNFYVDGGSIYVEIAVGVSPTPTETPIPNDPPTIQIDAPADGHSVNTGDSITFTGTASDPEDGDISSSIEWSSDIDGVLGTAASLNFVLSEGSHTITASVTDSGNNTETAQISVDVVTPSP